MRRCSQLFTILAVVGAGAARAEVPRFGGGIRQTVTPEAVPVYPVIGAAQVRLRTSSQTSLEVSLEMLRAVDALEMRGPFESVVGAQERRYVIDVDVAERFHLLPHTRSDLYALAGLGFRHEMINIENASGDVMYNGDAELRLRVVAGVGIEGRVNVGNDGWLVGLGAELRGVWLDFHGPDEDGGPPPLAKLGGELTGTLTLYH